VAQVGQLPTALVVCLLGGADKNVKEQVGILADIRKNSGQFAKSLGGQPKWWTKALKTMGIQMGIAGILKQSQIFTSTLGSLFQILGAFVDVMLAPWIPVIVPGLRKLANQVPKMRIAAQKFFEWATGSAWPWIKKIYNFLTKDLLNVSWWTGWVGTALGSIWRDIKIWGLEQLSAVWDFLPGWMKGDTNPFAAKLDALRQGQQGTTDAAEGAGDKTKEGMGKIETALVTLAGVWATAKTLRYGLQATRWIPFLAGITEPIRKVSKGVDLLFNRTAQAIGKGFLGLTRTLLSKIPGVPKIPVINPRGGPGGAPKGGTPRGTGPDVGGRAPKVASAMDDMTSAARYSKNYQDINWGRAGGDAAQEAGGGGGGVGRSKPNPKLAKATKAFKAFKDWLAPAWGKLQKAATSGGRGLKALVGEGMALARTMLGSVGGTALAKGAARIAVRFLKVIPFLGAAYMGAETTFDLKQMAESDVGWTGDMGSAQAWMKEGAGAFATLLGEGKSGMLNPMKWLRKGAEHLPGVGDWFKGKNEQLSRWKEAAGEGGALSGGKALDFGIRALTGYGGAGASFLPLIGQLAGGAVYEAGAYSSTGQVMGFGERKYGENDFAGASIEAILQMFGGAKLDVSVAGAPGTLQTQPIL